MQTPNSRHESARFRLAAVADDPSVYYGVRPPLSAAARARLHRAALRARAAQAAPPPPHCDG